MLGTLVRVSWCAPLVNLLISEGLAKRLFEKNLSGSPGARLSVRTPRTTSLHNPDIDPGRVANASLPWL